MVSTEIKLLAFFIAKDGEAVYSQQNKTESELVAQTMYSLLPNSDFN